MKYILSDENEHSSVFDWELAHLKGLDDGTYWRNVNGKREFRSEPLEATRYVDTCAFYVVNGVLHKEDGPAYTYIQGDAEKTYIEYYWEGKICTLKEYVALVGSKNNWNKKEIDNYLGYLTCIYSE